MGRKGFTLIEVLVALAISAIALLAIVKASTGSISQTDHLRHHVEAVWVAQDILSQHALHLLPKGQNAGEAIVLTHHYHWQLLSSDADRFVRVVVSDDKTQLLSLEY
jgi:general secretion pathway protein I